MLSENSHKAHPYATGENAELRYSMTQGPKNFNLCCRTLPRKMRTKVHSSQMGHQQTEQRKDCTQVYLGISDRNVGDRPLTHTAWVPHSQRNPQKSHHRTGDDSPKLYLWSSPHDLLAALLAEESPLTSKCYCLDNLGNGPYESYKF